MRYSYACVLMLTFVAAELRAEAQYPSWKECCECHDIEQEQCSKGKAGSACRKAHRRCDKIESECYELEQSIFGPEDGEVPSDPAPADATTSGDDADVEVPPEPDLVPPPRMPVSPAGETLLPPEATLPATVSAQESTPEIVPLLPPVTAVHPLPLVEPALQETPSRWTSGIAIASYCGVGVGVALTAAGVWQGLDAVAASRDFARATTQPEVFAAREIGMRAVTLANALLISGTVLAGTSAAIVLLNAGGAFDADDPALSLALAPGGAIVAWTMALP